MKETTIYLNDEEVKNFIIFQQHYESIHLMIEKGVFNQKGATVTLNFDKFGVLRSIGRADFLYIHGTTFDNSN